MRFRQTLPWILGLALTLVFVSSQVVGSARAASIQSSRAGTHGQAGSLTLVQLYPASIQEGETFNYQPKSRESALAVRVKNAQRGTVIVFAGHPLATSYSPTILTALIPGSLVSKPGTLRVYVKLGSSISNSMRFVVRPPLRLLKLYPGAVKVGQTFNYQANLHQSALAVAVRNAPPGTQIVFDGHALTTAYSPRLLSALMPESLYGKPGRYNVHLRYGTSRSNQLWFVVIG